MAIWDKTIVKVAGIIGALGVICTTGWATIDYLNIRPVMKREFLEMAQTQSEIIQNLQETQTKIIENQDWAAFSQLMSKQSTATLSPEERRELCRLAERFKMERDAGC